MSCEPVVLVPLSSPREPGQLQGLPAGGRRDGVPHRGAPPAGGALRQTLPHAWLHGPLTALRVYLQLILSNLTLAFYERIFFAALVTMVMTFVSLWVDMN